jgi:ribonuclease Y
MNSIEKIAESFHGIKKSYSFQSGREIWVIADSEKLTDFQTLEISKKIKEKIKKEIAIPGEVTINVVREKVFIQKLNDKKISNDEIGKKENKKEKNRDYN